MKFPIALQSSTVRDQRKEDYFGTFTKVAEIGYKGIEAELPPDGIQISEMKQRFDELGLHLMSCHGSLKQLTYELDTHIDYLLTMGGRYVVLSYHKFNTKSDVLEAAEIFNKIGEAARRRDIQFLYHNHDVEFVQFDGQYALDLLLDETDPELVQLELDTYWVKKAGIDPAAYINKLNNRCPLLHIKDMEPGEEGFFTEVGEGILDFPAIAEAAESAGTQWLIVEQDFCRRYPLDSIKISYHNLLSMGIVK